MIQPACFKRPDGGREVRHGGAAEGRRVRPGRYLGHDSASTVYGLPCMLDAMHACIDVRIPVHGTHRNTAK